MTTVSLPEEMSTFFANAHDKFPATIGKPSDDDVQRLCWRNLSALQDINLGDGTDVTGLIVSKDDHKAANANQMFDQVVGALEAYDPSVLDDDNNFVCLQAICRNRSEA